MSSPHDSGHLALAVVDAQPLCLSLEVTQAILKSANGKAPGPDGVPVDLYKSNMLFWAPILTNVLVATARSGKLPTWSQAMIIPIFKKGDRGDPACYRLISLLDSLAKDLGLVLLSRLEAWVEERQILSNIQCRFSSGMGTIEQCLKLTLLLGKYTISMEGYLFLGFRDLSCAFNSVSHSKLWDKLLMLGNDGRLVDLIRKGNGLYHAVLNTHSFTTHAFTPHRSLPRKSLP